MKDEKSLAEENEDQELIDALSQLQEEAEQTSPELLARVLAYPQKHPLFAEVRPSVSRWKRWLGMLQEVLSRVLTPRISMPLAVPIGAAAALLFLLPVWGPKGSQPASLQPAQFVYTGGPTPYQPVGYFRDPAQEKTAITATTAAFFEAWNAHDSVRLVSYLARDVDRITSGGNRTQDVISLKAVYDGRFQEERYKSSTHNVLDCHVRLLTPTVAIADVKTVLSGIQRKKGGEESPRPLIATFVLVKEMDQWRITAIRASKVSREKLDKLYAQRTTPPYTRAS
jgi:uncharacterized protein (TIGR02246 family)